MRAARLGAPSRTAWGRSGDTESPTAAPSRTSARPEGALPGLPSAPQVDAPSPAADDPPLALGPPSALPERPSGVFRGAFMLRALSVGSQGRALSERRDGTRRGGRRGDE